jgi:hypothetical protein
MNLKRNNYWINGTHPCMKTIPKAKNKKQKTKKQLHPACIKPMACCMFNK